jgi:hypothetical protein
LSDATDVDDNVAALGGVMCFGAQVDHPAGARRAPS